MVCNYAPVSEAEVQLASLPVLEKVQRFINYWINGTLDPIAKAHGGDPSSSLPQDMCKELFQKLVCQKDCLPASLMRELQFQGIAIPKPYPYIDDTVKNAWKPFDER